MWSQARFGSLRELRLESVVLPGLEADDVEVKVGAIGLNYADIFAVKGLYEAAVEAKEERFVPGLEFAGVVEAAGSASGFCAGDRVFGFKRFGCYADRLVQKAAYLRRTPEDWSDAEAASFVVNYATAYWGLVVLGQCSAGKNVLVSSAAGGVGLAALQICDALGANVTAIVGNAQKAVMLKDRGLTKIIVRPKRADLGYARDLGHPKFDVVLESLGGRFFDMALERLNPGGRLVHFGATTAYGSARDGPLKWPPQLARSPPKLPKKTHGRPRQPYLHEPRRLRLQLDLALRQPTRHEQLHRLPPRLPHKKRLLSAPPRRTNIRLPAPSRRPALPTERTVYGESRRPRRSLTLHNSTLLLLLLF